MHRPGLALSLARFFLVQENHAKRFISELPISGFRLKFIREPKSTLLWSGGAGGAGAGKDLVEATRLIRVDESAW